MLENATPLQYGDVEQAGIIRVGDPVKVLG